ncbi:Signal transduction histidine kinase [Micromonospora viridifaciens]|uniref:Oxygen sensor histidine kinase NreB n=1 Tax=Micromonospora viridifaciens TaxID=1881 RepID=A0A1C4XT34_MICVI|nr:sensor histidine kinase [Micromonospora viridifaciens]SCF11271.1 Signal transduction histidine kinase [Micromonospora viridifaciens]
MREDRLRSAMRWGFLLLLAASASRYVAYHGGGAATVGVLALAGVLLAAYAVNELGRFAPGVRFAAVIVAFLALVLVAPSFAWCAIPLFFLGLRQLPQRAVWPLVGLLTAAVVIAQIRLADRFDPSLLLGPVGIAAITTTVFLELDRQNRARQRALDDLLATRDELNRSQHEAGALAERARLSREIHDTLAQGLSSMNLLLQAADQEWDTEPTQARGHVRQASATARENLAEARRFVRGLASPALDNASLTDALRRLCAATERDTGTPVRFTVAGTVVPLGVDNEITLLRVAQSALANVRRHAHAHRTAVTLTYGDEEVMLDVYDDGTGFDPTVTSGFGLTGIRERIAHLGGTVTIESAPGEGTALAVSLPLREAR